ncbi:MAG: hypothetical protein HYR66_17960 [Sphingobacteriales bacterium]|nr:hypothetical protein [Sphingobacteriales bacterium]MBI3720120.1 hypothetical protein [Sphingobacteriales bacterium]
MRFILLFFITVISSIMGCKIISAGSYPYAQVYNYKINEDTLISMLTTLKERDSNLIPPATLNLVDGRSDSTDYWYHIYFYNKNENEIIHTWVRKKDKQITNLVFVGINQGLALGNWKEINKDYNKADNKRKIKEFQNLILKRISIGSID